MRNYTLRLKTVDLIVADRKATGRNFRDLVNLLWDDVGRHLARASAIIQSMKWWE